MSRLKTGGASKLERPGCPWLCGFVGGGELTPLIGGLCCEQGLSFMGAGEEKKHHQRPVLGDSPAWSCYCSQCSVSEGGLGTCGGPERGVEAQRGVGMPSGTF